MIRPPDGVSRLAHAIEEFPNDFFFISKVKIQIAGANLQILRNMIRRDWHNAVLIEQFDASLQNALSVFRSFHEDWSFSSKCPTYQLF